MRNKNNNKIVHYYLRIHLILLLSFIFILWAGAKRYISDDINALSTSLILLVFGLWWVTNLFLLVFSIIQKFSNKIIISTLIFILTPLVIYSILTRYHDPIIDTVIAIIALMVNVVFCLITLLTDK